MDKQEQWRMFRKKIGAAEAPENFCEITAQVEKFLLPVISIAVLSPVIDPTTPRRGSI